MSKPRRSELWSKHTAIPQSAAPGSPFAGHMMLSCMRCGSHRIQAALEKDAMFRGQRRCTDREICATARGGKS